MKIIVTGSQGFIGSKIVEFLLPKHKVTGIDSFNKVDSNEPWAIERNKLLEQNLNHKNFKFICWNLLNEQKFYDSEQEKLFDTLAKKIDIVIHCAAIVGVDKHIKDTGLFLKNLELDQRVLRWCKDSHLIYFSSSEVYGGASINSTNSDLVISSELRSNYALEKLFVERMIQAKLKDYTILRPFNVTGPIQNPENSVIPKFVKGAINNEELIVYCDEYEKTPKRTFLHIDDFIAGIQHIIKNLKKYNKKIINVGSEKIQDIYELAETIIELTKSDSKVKREFARENDNVILYRKPYDTIFDDTKIVPYDIDKIIKDIIRIYK